MEDKSKLKDKPVPPELKEWTNPKAKWGTEKLPIGGVVPYHTAWGFSTGDWGAEKPVISHEKCIGCLDCFYYCPDSAIEIIEVDVDGKMKSKAIADYTYCKGCGVCAMQCKHDAIVMEEMS